MMTKRYWLNLAKSVAVRLCERHALDEEKLHVYLPGDQPGKGPCFRCEEQKVRRSDDKRRSVK